MPINYGDKFLLGVHTVQLLDCRELTSEFKSSFGLTVFDPPYDDEGLYEVEIKSPKALIFYDYKRVAQAVRAAKDFEYVYEFIWDGVTSWYTPNRPLARHKGCLFCSDNPAWGFAESTYVDGKTRKSKVVSNTRGKYLYAPKEPDRVHLQTVYQYPNTRVKGPVKHSKPLPWISALLAGSKSPLVLDLFLGGGSTILGAPEGVVCYGVEKDPAALQACLDYYQAATGTAPRRV